MTNKRNTDRSMMTKISVIAKGSRIGVNRDDQPVGYAVRTSRKGKPEQWTAYVYQSAAPFDWTRTGFVSGDAATAFIAAHGETPDHLQR